MTNQEMAQSARNRPANYAELPEAEQWAIDKALGILDWDGTDGKEIAHRREYENALAYANHEGPPWENLTEEQRENVRKANREFWSDMDALGDAIRNGSPLPDIKLSEH